MKDLTDAELLLLGLVAEMPRHGYELDQVIEERGMREWTQIGFSSIYFVLGKLQKLGLVTAKKPAGARRHEGQEGIFRHAGRAPGIGGADDRRTARCSTRLLVGPAWG